MSGSWDAMIQRELDRSAPIDAVPGIVPSPSVPLAAFSSQAGLATLRGAQTRANLPRFTGSRF